LKYKVNLFSSLGAIHALGTQANLIGNDGKVINFGKSLFSDCVGGAIGLKLHFYLFICAFMIGPIFGTSTVTSFVESGTGISVGGRTGVTSLVISFGFFLSIFISPVFNVIPLCATAPALIVIFLFLKHCVLIIF
jgi:AGZA family xanthine/uracil permease-like MFS transporter